MHFEGRKYDAITLDKRRKKFVLMMLPWCGAKSVSVISGGESNIINRVRETVLAFCSSSNRMPYDGSVRLHSTAILSEHYFYKYLKSVPAALWSEVMPDHVKVCWSLLKRYTMSKSHDACLTTTDWTVLNGTTVEIFVNIPRQKIAIKYLKVTKKKQVYIREGIYEFLISYDF